MYLFVLSKQFFLLSVSYYTAVCLLPSFIEQLIRLLRQTSLDEQIGSVVLSSHFTFLENLDVKSCIFTLSYLV